MLHTREEIRKMIDDKKGVKNTPTTNSTSSNTDNATKSYNGFPNERLEIAREAMNFLPNYPRIRAIVVRPHDKIPSEYAWQSVNNYPVSSKRVYAHLLNGGNWGLMHPSGMSVGIDRDSPRIGEAVKSLGDTLGWNTGTPGHYCDIFLIKDLPVGNIPLVDGAYIRGKGGQNLAPGSIHPNGHVYGSTYLHLVPPLLVSKAELLKAFEPVIIGKEKLGKNETKPEYKAPLKPDSLAMKDLVDVSGFKQSGNKFQGPHPIHGSSTGTNFVVDFESNEWVCFRHGTGGGPLQWIAVSTGVISCQESTPGKIKGDLFWKVIAAAHNQYRLSYNQLAKSLGGDQYGKR